MTGAGPSDSQAPPTPLHGSFLEWFAFLFRRCATEFHWTPTQVDVLEVWEVGAALGAATGEVEEWVQSRPVDQTGALNSGRDLTAERIAASKGLGPPPEAEVMSPNQIRFIQETIRVS